MWGSAMASQRQAQSDAVTAVTGRYRVAERDAAEPLVKVPTAATIDPCSASSDAAAMAKRKMEMQQRAQGIRMKYIDRLATVLNAGQVDRFFEVESIIQKKLKERRDQASGQ